MGFSITLKRIDTSPRKIYVFNIKNQQKKPNNLLGSFPLGEGKNNIKIMNSKSVLFQEIQEERGGWRRGLSARQGMCSQLGAYWYHSLLNASGTYGRLVCALYSGATQTLNK